MIRTVDDALVWPLKDAWQGERRSHINIVVCSDEIESAATADLQILLQK